MKYVFKIRDTKTGLYRKPPGSTRYGTGAWSKTGKSWSSPAHVKAHLAYVIDDLVGKKAERETTEKLGPRPRWGEPGYSEWFYANSDRERQIKREEAWQLLPKNWEIVRMPIAEAEVLTMEEFYRGA